MTDMQARGSRDPAIPDDMPALPGGSWKVAVVTDLGSAAPDRTTAVAGMKRDLQLIAVQSGLRCVATAVTSSGADDLAGQLNRLPPSVGAIFLTGTDRPRARDTQRIFCAETSRPLITDDDADAIALTAAALTYLNGLGRPLRLTRVVIAGATRVPVLCPLLLTAGIFDIALWNDDDPGPPLTHVVRDADVVINLLGDDPQVAGLTPDRPIDSVISVGEHERLLALPGLFRAIAGAPGPLIEVTSFHAASHGVMRAAQRGRLLPLQHSPRLMYEVAHSVSRVINPAYPRWPLAGYDTPVSDATSAAQADGIDGR